MTNKQRLINQILGQPVDRIPMIGGWNIGLNNLAAAYKHLAAFDPQSKRPGPLRCQWPWKLAHPE